MRLRSHEVMKIQEALEKEYASPREASTEIFNLVAELLAQRRSIVVGVRLRLVDTVTLAYGPFWERGTANRFIQKMSGYGFQAFVANVYQPVAPLQAEPSPWCECGHPVSVHNVSPSGKRGRCLRKGCQCGRGRRQRTS